MPLPYYSKRKNEHLFSGHPEILMIPEIIKVLEGIPKRELGNIPHPYLRSFAKGYDFAERALYHSPEIHKALKLSEPFESGLSIWKNTIRIYHELSKLIVDLGNLHKMYEIYLKSIDYLVEGHQDLYNCDLQIKKVKEEDIEVKFKALMDKYHSLHEANIKYTLSLCIYCLDCITEHKDSKNKNAIKYCQDDVSYKIKKIEACKKYSFINEPSYLKRGVFPNIRNSISHKTFEYNTDFTVTFHDRSWKITYKYGDFEKLVEALQINFFAQSNSLVLFEWDNHPEITKIPIAREFNTKKIIMIFDEVIRSLSFSPKNIDIDNEKKIVICDIEKTPGFDNPTEIFGNLGGQRFAHKQKGLKVDVQAYGIIVEMVSKLDDFEKIHLNIFEFKEKPLGKIVYNLDTLKKILSNSNYTLEDLKQNAEESNI
jgi:hypothetical protein